MKEKIKAVLKNVIEFLLNPRLLLCFGIAWLITNGWSYILFTVGTVYEITWMVTLSGAYLTFLWLPVSPEKLVTVALAVALLRIFFPNDQKTLSKLKRLHKRISQKFKKNGKN
ncbi:MAG: hypothetical protein IKL05_05765 [Clostridia bacterium]|nr:hypothetical protein [Clostridia bacterium]